MGILLWIVFGGLVGWIASMIMNTNGQQGLFLNIIIGIIGAVTGGWIMSYFGKSDITGFNFYSFAVAILGACLLIFIVKLLK